MGYLARIPARAFRALPAVFSLGAPCLRACRREFTDEDLYHTRAITEWLADTPAGALLHSFHVIDVEDLDQGFSRLESMLCSERSYCSGLPRFPRVNAFS